MARAAPMDQEAGPETSIDSPQPFHGRSMPRRQNEWVPILLVSLVAALLCAGLSYVLPATTLSVIAGTAAFIVLVLGASGIAAGRAG